MADPERHIFGENGVVLNWTAQPTDSLDDQFKKPDRLKRREPTGLFKAIAWLLAGPLNVSAIIWLGFRPMGLEAEGIIWLVSVPSAFAIGFLLVSLEHRPKTNTQIFRAALKALMSVSAVIVGFFALWALVAGPTIAALVGLYGTMFAAIFGLPASIVGALTIRLVLFKWHPVDNNPSAPLILLS